MKVCVYTSLIGKYELLNEQPVAAQSSISFICLTDDPDLKSSTWEIRQVSPAFKMDPIRSQREFKLRPHIYLPEFDISIYIDNSVLLTQVPEVIIDRHFPTTGFSIARHSYRETVLDEFLQVSKDKLEDQSRIFEQLHHYLVASPEVLTEKPYWGGIQVRDHRNPLTRAALDIWCAHVNRYSRRDQLSVNAVFAQVGLIPNIMDIDIYESFFHKWPNIRQRRNDIRTFKPNSRSELANALLAIDKDLADKAFQYEKQALEQANKISVVYSSRNWMVVSLLIKIAERFPRVTSVGWRVIRKIY